MSINPHLNFLRKVQKEHIFPKLLCTSIARGGDKLTYIEIVLEEVLISSFSHAANTDGNLPSEAFSLNYSKIKFNYTQQKRADGQGGGKISASWDRTSNKTY